jgi:hypothetical protein
MGGVAVTCERQTDVRLFLEKTENEKGTRSELSAMMAKLRNGKL